MLLSRYVKKFKKKKFKKKKKIKKTLLDQKVGKFSIYFMPW